ncbi:hypothetical protein [Mycobacterium syngnathidarum]|uniref:PAS domain S-box/diguanylate cyclase (GGDEF) domain-containing protein n=1 Tax=Mycobacterium syngnathidarum TaxID=1908205 RepID=A0A1S1K157_9MYCO|nr:hypothetical protein [Mycobacterium syngnathidarum]OHT97669.1 hypothetical protein BKG61_15660 [Mycobacterium syngnathidarum]
MSDIESGPDDTLSPSESTDSDEVANADGDEVVDPPAQWHGADRAGRPESLDDRLAEEEPDVTAAEPRPRDVDENVAEPRDVEIVHPDDNPEDDGDSLYPVVK